MRLVWHQGVMLADSKRERRELVVGPSRNVSGGLPLTISWDQLRAPSLTETLFQDPRSVLASLMPGLGGRPSFQLRVATARFSVARAA